MKANGRKVCRMVEVDRYTKTETNTRGRSCMELNSAQVFTNSQMEVDTKDHSTSIKAMEKAK